MRRSAASEPLPLEAAGAEGDLARLNARMVDARAALDQLERDIDGTRSRLGATRAAQLVEANEALVLAALRAREEADAASLALRDAARSAAAAALTRAPPADGVDGRYGHLREANAELLGAAMAAQTLQAEAERVQERQTELLALVAHELRNPLNPLRMAAALLGRVGPDELPRLQSIIERQVQRVARLASDLLDVARVRSGKLRLERQVVDLADVVEEALEACRPAMALRSQHLGVGVPTPAPRLHGDAQRLVQVLGNLLDNASKYTPDGGAIRLDVELAQDRVVVSVSDTGIGMSPGALSEVFEPFVQEAHAVNANGLGLGLGLAVARQLVEAHGGSIAASSAGVGRGSRFVVTLPCSGEAAGSAAPLLPD